MAEWLGQGRPLAASACVQCFWVREAVSAAEDAVAAHLEGLEHDDERRGRLVERGVGRNGMTSLYRGQHRSLGGGGFFFSSRRRHTRLQGDWSSDVCSSD